MPGSRKKLTQNRTGWVSRELSPLSQRFVDFCRQVQLPVLDLGAGFGLATLAALETGARVIANDLDERHLQELINSVPSEHAQRLQLKPGRFPRQLHFEPATLGAIHASSVLHFLTGRQLDEGFRAMTRWLTPGGKLFVQAATPFLLPFASFIPEYERRLHAGERWPGWVEKISTYSTHRQLGQMPASIHLLDKPELARLCAEHGLIVEYLELYRRPDLPVSLWLDRRESVGLIASPSAAR